MSAIMSCPQCRGRFRVSGGAPGVAARCPRCNVELVVDPSAPVPDEPGAGQPQPEAGPFDFSQINADRPPGHAPTTHSSPGAGPSYPWADLASGITGIQVGMLLFTVGLVISLVAPNFGADGGLDLRSPTPEVMCLQMAVIAAGMVAVFLGHFASRRSPDGTTDRLAKSSLTCCGLSTAVTMVSVGLLLLWLIRFDPKRPPHGDVVRQLTIMLYLGVVADVFLWAGEIAFIRAIIRVARLEAEERILGRAETVIVLSVLALGLRVLIGLLTFAGLGLVRGGIDPIRTQPSRAGQDLAAVVTYGIIFTAFLQQVLYILLLSAARTMMQRPTTRGRKLVC